MNGRTFAVLLALAVTLAGCNREDSSVAASEADLAALSALDAKLTALEGDIAAIATYEGIWANELEYTRGLDRHDEALIGNVFWPDAKASYGTLVEIATLPSWANASHANSAAHQHHVTGLSLDIDGDTAHEEGDILYSSDMQRNKALDTDGIPTPGRAVIGSLATLGTGRYVNRYERRDGDWRLIVHEYVNDISMRLEAVDLCATGCLGRWDPSDISYLRPLQPLTVEERHQRSEAGTMPHAALVK